MKKQITKIALTGGPAAGKTSLISRILKEFLVDNGWKVITVPETASELISEFGLGPFEGCMSMLDFQYFVISDQLHKEELALKGAEIVPQEKVLIVYDRAIFDDRAYIPQDEFETVLASFGKTPDEMLTHYDAVLHLVTSAKGAEFAYNYGNAARYESVADARIRDDVTLEAWSAHPNVHVIDNSVNFEDKINRAIAEIYKIVGLSVPEVKKHKYLINMPDDSLIDSLNATEIHMAQTYLANTVKNADRRVRKHLHTEDSMYFYAEKRLSDDGETYVTEKPISEKQYNEYLREADSSLATVEKIKYRFEYNNTKMEIDKYPFSKDRAILFIYGDAEIPYGIDVISDVTGDYEYKNRRLARKQSL